MTLKTTTETRANLLRVLSQAKGKRRQLRPLKRAIRALPMEAEALGLPDDLAEGYRVEGQNVFFPPENAAKIKQHVCEAEIDETTADAVLAYIEDFDGFTAGETWVDDVVAQLEARGA